ncbi:2'-5' RNA ligase family protein [Nonomuraea endophytica]|uniref:2'-5' RNA ligase family protein n=1 Tax=Nonomuraea endophytica TaxID=714136 RepID=UPI0035E45D43
MTHVSELSPQGEDWQRFSTLTTMRDHWENPHWTPGRQAFFWYLCVDSPELRQLSSYCQQRLPQPFLNHVPLDALHLTLSRVGWHDEVSNADVNAVFNAATSSCAGLKPFTMTIGPVSGSPGAVRFSVGPWEPIVDLYRRLFNSTQAVLGTHYESEFRPHVGIAYCDKPVPAKPLIKAVSSLRDLPVIELLVSKVDLVLLRREGRTYRWTTIQSLHLK